MESTVDNSQVFRALLTDLSRTFHCISHEEIIAKLNAYDFTLPTVKLINNCLTY